MCDNIRMALGFKQYLWNDVIQLSGGPGSVLGLFPFSLSNSETVVMPGQRTTPLSR